MRGVLFVTGCVPTTAKPAAGPFIGHRIAALARAGVRVTVLWPSQLAVRDAVTARGVLRFLRYSLFPVLAAEDYCFRGVRYRVYAARYTLLSRPWFLLGVFFLGLFGRYSLLHYHFLWYTSELAILKKIFGCPVVVTVHGSDMHRSATGSRAFRSKYKRAIDSADRVIYVSESLRSVARSLGLAGERDIVIPNGYDPGMFGVTPAPPLPLTFGFVGHLVRVKRADKLPEIFAGIREALPDARLIVVGGAGGENLRSEMEAEFAARGLAGAVEFAGEVRPEDVAGDYARMHVLLMPSRNEGFPNVPIEARACGVPVVGSDNGGVPEAVGGGGVIVEEGPGFEARFAAAAVELARNLPGREEVAAGARGLEWDGIAAREMAVYREASCRG